MRSPFLRAGAAALALVVASGCVSSTMINTVPPGARIYLDGALVGNTPYVMSDTKIVGAVTHVHLQLEGYEPLDIAITRSEQFDVGACIGGFFVLVPFIWIMGYTPNHVYELQPLRAYLGPAPVG
jgi:hypothetical protein